MQPERKEHMAMWSGSLLFDMVDRGIRRGFCGIWMQTVYIFWWPEQQRRPETQNAFDTSCSIIFFFSFLVAEAEHKVLFTFLFGSGVFFPSFWLRLCGADHTSTTIQNTTVLTISASSCLMQCEANVFIIINGRKISNIISSFSEKIVSICGFDRECWRDSGGQVM